MHRLSGNRAHHVTWRVKISHPIPEFLTLKNDAAGATQRNSEHSVVQTRFVIQLATEEMPQTLK